MEFQDLDELGAELAFCEAELEGEELGAVRHYWSRVIAEELGAVETEVPPTAWAEMSAGERALLRRRERRTSNTTLRLVADEVSASQVGEAA